MKFNTHIFWMKKMKKHDKPEFKDLFLSGYRHNNWFDIQDDEESDDKTLEGDKEETVDIPSTPPLEKDEEQVK